MLMLTTYSALGQLCSTVSECLGKTLWHLPGPNPIISPWQPDGKPAWMDRSNITRPDGPPGGGGGMPVSVWDQTKHPLDASRGHR